MGICICDQVHWHGVAGPIIYTVSQKNVLSNFCNNFIKYIVDRFWKFFHCWKTAINYLQNKYTGNTSRHLLEALLHYHVKHKSLKSAFALPILDDKAVNSTIVFFKHLKKHITLLTYYFLPCPATCVLITSSQSWGTVGHLAWPSTECTW